MKILLVFAVIGNALHSRSCLLPYSLCMAIHRHYPLLSKFADIYTIDQLAVSFMRVIQSASFGYNQLYTQYSIPYKV